MDAPTRCLLLFKGSHQLASHTMFPRGTTRPHYFVPLPPNTPRFSILASSHPLLYSRLRKTTRPTYGHPFALSHQTRLHRLLSVPLHSHPLTPLLPPPHPHTPSPLPLWLRTSCHRRRYLLPAQRLFLLGMQQGGGAVIEKVVLMNIKLLPPPATMFSTHFYAGVMRRRILSSTRSAAPCKTLLIPVVFARGSVHSGTIIISTQAVHPLDDVATARQVRLAASFLHGSSVTRAPMDRRTLILKP